MTDRAPSTTCERNFENGGFTLKTHQMFSLRTMPEEFKNAAITGHLDLSLRKSWSGKSHDYRDAIILAKTVFKMCSVLTKAKSRRFQIPPV